MNAEDEVSWWQKVYPEFEAAVCVEVWSGHKVVRMPHFSAVPAADRADMLSFVEDALRKFDEANVVHRDVKWRNLGRYRGADGAVRVVLYDLGRVRSKTGEDGAWVDTALQGLRETMQ
jgi:hypothetical protein